MKKLVFATGNYFKLGLSPEQQIKLLEKLPIDGVELTFRKDELEDTLFKNTKLLDFIKRYKYNSIHFPFGKEVILTEDNFNYYKWMLTELVKRINAVNVVFHVDNVEDLKLLYRFEFKVSLENTVSDSKYLFKFIMLTKLDVTFDTSHALVTGTYKSLLRNLSSKISNVHLSNVRKGKKHQQFKNNFSLVMDIKELDDNVVIIVEETFTNISDIRVEVKRIREWLDK